MTKANELAQRAPWKATNLAEAAKFGKTLSKGFTKANELAQVSWESGKFSKSTEFGENGEFDETLPKGLTKANELAQRAPWKAANLAKAASLAKICQRV